MAVYTTYMNYVIFFSDQAEYDFAVAVAGSNLIALAPRTAGALFGIPFPYPSGDMATIPKGIYFIPPFTVGTQINHPGPSGINVDDTVDSQLVPGQAGNPATIWPAGPDVLLVWSGAILKTNGGAGSNPLPVVTIPQRRWIGSPEWEPTTEGGTGISALNQNRDCSRTIDGHGFAIRGANNTGVWNRLVASLRAVPAPSVLTYVEQSNHKQWERFYIRIRNPGAVPVGIWRAHGSVSVNAGAGLKVNADRSVSAFQINAVSTETLIATTAALNLNEWYLFDVIITYRDTPTGLTATFRLYINHVLAISGANDNQEQAHVSSDLGKWTGVADTGVEIDLDSWIAADVPVDPTILVPFGESLNSVDWLMGSNVRRYYVDSATLVNWAGNQGALNQGNSPASALTNILTSSTALAVMEGLTEVPLIDVQDTIGVSMGAVAAIIGSLSRNAAGTDGSLGYKIAGGVAVDATINQTAADSFLQVPYFPSGLVVPNEISPFSIRHVKSNDANLDTTSSLSAVIEYIGTWGSEDDALWGFDISRLSFLHNCRYGNTAWGYVGSVPDAPCYAVGGTYVGNGTYQEVVLPAACHFLWIRPITGAPTGGIKWFGASIDAHFGAKDRVIPNLRVWSDINAIFQFSVSGNSIEINQNTIVYQYIAFCDPGMRYNLCGAFEHGSTGPSPQTNLLIDPAFTPVGGFVQSDLIGSAASNAQGLFYKGPGNGASDGNSLTGASIATFGAFGLGLLASQTGLHLAVAQMNYSLWRITQPGCAGVMVQILSYVGNGTNPRNIPLTPTSGRFPLFVLVVPVAATSSFYRDPSHAGANSCNADTLANSALAITGVAIDQITVNSALNANGTVYNVFCIPGDTLGMNNGTFFNFNCVPPDGPYIDPTPVAVDIAVMGEGGITLNGTVPLTILKDVSGIYTLVPGKTDDTLYDRLAGQPDIDVKIPDPLFKTGYIGG